MVGPYCRRISLNLSALILLYMWPYILLLSLLWQKQCRDGRICLRLWFRDAVYQGWEVPATGTRGSWSCDGSNQWAEKGGYCCWAHSIFSFTPGPTPTFRMGLPASINCSLETPSATCTCEVCPLGDFISVKLTKTINLSGVLLMATLKAFWFTRFQGHRYAADTLCFITELLFN